jgi:sec-independent protein translocase protein TatB
MFDLGIQELIVIFIVALLVFGPKRLPEIGRTLGKGLGELKRSMQGVKDQMDAELKDIRQPVSFDTILNSPQEPARKVETPAGATPHTGNGHTQGEVLATAVGPENQGETPKTPPEAGKNTETGSEKGPKG